MSHDNDEEPKDEEPKDEEPKDEENSEGELLPDLIKDLPENQQKFLSRIIKANIEYSGPLPPPGMLEKYEQILSGAADRVFKLTENEQDIRREGMRGVLANERLKTHCATFLGLSIIVVSGIATFNGYPIIAVPLGIAGVTLSVARLIINAIRGRQDEE